VGRGMEAGDGRMGSSCLPVLASISLVPLVAVAVAVAVCGHRPVAPCRKSKGTGGGLAYGASNQCVSCSYIDAGSVQPPAQFPSLFQGCQTLGRQVTGLRALRSDSPCCRACHAQTIRQRSNDQGWVARDAGAACKRSMGSKAACPA